MTKKQGSQEWKTVRLGDIAILKGGNAFREELQGNSSGSYPFIKVSDMELIGNSRYIISANHWISEEIKNKEAIHLFPVGAVIFAKVGAALLLNRRRILTRSTAIDNNLMAAKPKGITTDYLFYLLSNIDFDKFALSGAVPSVNQIQLSLIKVELPPAPEQAKIAEVLSTVDKAIAETEALIAKQQRIKTGLISTGFNSPPLGATKLEGGSAIRRKNSVMPRCLQRG